MPGRSAMYVVDEWHDFYVTVGGAAGRDAYWQANSEFLCDMWNSFS